MSENVPPHPQESQRFDVIAYKRLEVERGNATASRSLDWYRTTHGIRSDIEIQTVLSHLQLRPNFHVLDMGSGVGRITLAMAPRVQSVTAVDISPKNIEVLRRHASERGLTNITARASDMNELTLSGEQYDRAVAVQSIQHIPGAALRLDAVQRIRDALRPGGVFVMVNYRWGGMISDEKEGTHADGRYRYAYTPEEMQRSLRDAGFRRISVGGCINVPYRAEWIAKLAPWAFVRMDVYLSHIPLSCRSGKYLIATGMV
ncbi:MAG: class I SAM-dependent methyltransferase [Nitrospiraceae bacterium]